MSALSHGLRKGARTILQLIAGGALTALVSAVAGGLSAGTQATVLAAWTAVVAVVQNGLEQAGKIPTILPTSPTPQTTPAADLASPDPQPSPAAPTPPGPPRPDPMP